MTKPVAFERKTDFLIFERGYCDNCGRTVQECNAIPARFTADELAKYKVPIISWLPPEVIVADDETYACEGCDSVPPELLI